MSDQVNEALASLDERIEALQNALAESDWDRLADLNRDVRSLVDPVMTAMESGQLSVEAVQQRLTALNAFVQQADAAARQAREDAREALEQVGQNRKAVNAYAKVSSRSR